MSLALLALLTPSSPTRTQSKHAEIVRIITSLPKVKGVRVQINAEFFGKQYFECRHRPQQDTFTGVVDKWKSAKDKTVLMIKWEGASTNTSAPQSS